MNLRQREKAPNDIRIIRRDPSVNSDTYPIVLSLVALNLITKSTKVATKRRLKVIQALHFILADIARTCRDEMPAF